MLAFTSVYFFESGLFNGLRAIQIKKSSLPRFILHVYAAISFAPRLGRVYPGGPEFIAQISDFANIGAGLSSEGALGRSLLFRGGSALSFAR
jgi:hypothetical protein